jgi:Methyl-coenzyme M reductase operon protein C
MYQVLLFNGGIYKFIQLQEYLDDVGGLLIREDRLQITRGTSFLSEQIRVTLVVPTKEVESIKLLANEIKGEIEILKIDQNLENLLISFISIYNILSLTNNWITTEEIKLLMECPCQSNICREDEKCTFNEIENILDKMCSLKILETRQQGKQEFRILQDNGN